MESGEVKMAFGIKTEAGAGGDFTPIVKINAKAGRVYRVDRSQTAEGGWSTDEVDITNTFAFIPDFEQMEIGWMFFQANSAPDLRMVPLGDPMPDRPAGVDKDGKPNFKQGIRLKVKLGKGCGGDVREIAATAMSVLGPFDRLHDTYVAGLAENPGKAPQVKMTGVKKIDTKTPKGTNTNFEPIFEIVGWVDLPAELRGGQPANEAKQEAVAQAKTTSQVQAEPASDDGNEF
jgi:hypothetical protein